jgi:hypothetical protein
MPVADIDGLQRKIIRAAVRPVRLTYGENGIPVRGGETLPFVVERGWNAPLGYYNETWYLVHPESGEVLYEGPQRVRLINGLPSVTDVSDEMSGGFRLDPGSYKIVFALDTYKGGEIDVEAIEAPAEEVA